MLLKSKHSVHRREAEVSMNFLFYNTSFSPKQKVKKTFYYILKETSHAKSKLVLSEWTPRLCLCFVLYNMRLIKTFIIAMYSVMNYSLLMLNLVAFMQN